MPETKEMERQAIDRLLQNVGYGHLGFIHEGKPAIISVHYYLQDTEIYLFLATGNNTYDFDNNPHVCLQIEDVKDAGNWRSATVNGSVERLSVEPNIDSAIDFIKSRHPEVATGIDRDWMESWGSEREIAIYHIHIDEMKGIEHN